MVNAWETEDEEVEQPFSKDDWDKLSILERADKAKQSGLEGKLGAKPWDELTPAERATIQNPEKRPVSLEYQVKAHVRLEDSDKENWGMVRDIGPVLDQVFSEGELVGTWTHSPVDGLIHVHLETPLTALVDKATQKLAEYVERRRQTSETKATRARTRTPRAPKPEPEPEVSENMAKIGDIRKLLGK